jgi:hypothetical protein
MTDWRDMAEFAAVDLEDSFILGWQYAPEAGGLAFEVGASLWPGHPAYEPPQRGEHTCYKRTAMLFVNASVIGRLPQQSDVEPGRDADGREDYGSFDTLSLDDGTYRVVTDFADVLIRCDRVTFDVSS